MTEELAYLGQDRYFLYTCSGVIIMVVVQQTHYVYSLTLYLCKEIDHDTFGTYSSRRSYLNLVWKVQHRVCTAVSESLPLPGTIFWRGVTYIFCTCWYISRH